MTFKMHQIHILSGLRPIRTLGSSPHFLVSCDLGKGGAAGRTLAPDATDPRAATVTSRYIYAITRVVMVAYYVTETEVIML